MKRKGQLLLLLLLWMASCKQKQDVTSGVPHKPGNGPMTEPDQLKPEIDTRFQEAFFTAQKEKAIGNKEKAYQLFEQCLALDPENASVHYELARFDIENNNLSGAVSHARKALEKDDTNPWYHKTLADIFYMQGKYDQAYKEYNFVEKLNPEDPDALNAEANALLAQGKKTEAIRVLDRMELRDGINEELSMEKHRLYLEEENIDKAEGELLHLSQAFPSEPRFWGYLVQFYQRTSQRDKVGTALEGLKNCGSASGQVHMQLSEYYASTGDDAKSYSELVEAFRTTDVTIDQKIAVLLRFYTLSESNSLALSRAYDLLRICEATHPAEAKIHSMFGDYLNRDMRLEEAREKYRKAVELDPSRHVIWNEILVIDSQLMDYVALKKESGKSIELFPSFPDFYYYNGVACHRLKDFTQSRESLNLGKEMVVDNDRLLVQFYSLLGEVNHELGQFDQSDASYEKVLKMDPENAYAMNNYAYFLSLRNDKTERAAELSKRSLELMPDNDSFMDTYAVVLFRQGRMEEALQWIEKAFARAGNNGEVLEHYGDILSALGRSADALLRWKEAEKAGNDHPALLRKIAAGTFVE